MSDLIEREPGKKKKLGTGRRPLRIPKTKAVKIKAPSVAVLDHLFSKFIRLRAANECQLWKYGGITCSDQLHCSHIISRTYTSVRWDQDNAIAACAAHHRAQHNLPSIQAEWLKDLLGEDHLTDLHERWRNGKKPTPAERIEKAKWLREQIAELEGGK